MENVYTYSVIPSVILDDRNLKSNDIILYARISSLSNKYGYCFATNKYLENIVGLSTRSIQRSLKRLIDNGYISHTIVYGDDNNNVIERRLKLTYKFLDEDYNDDKYDVYGHDKYDAYNSISGNSISIKEKEKYKKEKESFKKPTIEEIKSYCDERKNYIDPEQFFDFYESKNWFVGKNKMKDWKASIRTWERRRGYKPLSDKSVEVSINSKTAEDILLEAGIGLGWLDRDDL